MTTHSDTNSTADWMKNLPQSLKELPLSRLAIPGTHDTGAFYLNCRGPVAPDAQEIVRTVSWIPGAKKVSANWGVTQGLNFTQQLEAGIRYFDLRVAACPMTKKLYLVHTLYGPKVEDMISDVNAFLLQHSGEIVMLDFNHFYGMETSDHKTLLGKLLSVFGSRLCAADFPVSSLSLDEMIAQGKRVIVFYQSWCQLPIKAQVATKASICSPWANTADPVECVEFLDSVFAYPPACDFVVCQGVVTPMVSTVLFDLCGSLHKLNRTLSPLLMPWLSDTPHHLNIVITDFVEGANFISTVLERNHRPHQKRDNTVLFYNTFNSADNVNGGSYIFHNQKGVR